MKVLVIGSGGREHAIAWRCAQSAVVEKVFVAPGNAGTASEAKLENIAIDVLDFPGLAAVAESESVALTIVGPETPLVAGIVDYFQQRQLASALDPARQPRNSKARKPSAKTFWPGMESRPLPIKHLPKSLPLLNT